MTDWDSIIEETVKANQAASDTVSSEVTARRLEQARLLAIREGWSDGDGNTLLPNDDENEEDEI